MRLSTLFSDSLGENLHQAEPFDSCREKNMKPAVPCIQVWTESPNREAVSLRLHPVMKYSMYKSHDCTQSSHEDIGINV